MDPQRTTNESPHMHAHMTQPYRGIRFFTLATLSSASLVLSMPVAAELSPALDRVSVSVGVFRADPKINTSLNTSYGSFGTGDIELGKETMPRIKADIMIFDSQGLSLDYYQYKQGHVTSTGGTSTINGTAITAVGGTNLDFKLDFAKLAYKWWIGSGNTVLGLGAGAAYYKVDLNASATASINNSTANISGEYAKDAVAPLLEVGLRHAISSDLRLFLNASGAKKSGGRLSGDIYNAVVGVEWFPVKNVGVVFDYGVSQINLNRLDTIDTNLKFKIQGPSTFVKVRF